MSEKLDVETIEAIGRIVREPVMERLASQDRVLQSIVSGAAANAKAADDRWSNHENRIGSLESSRARTFWIWGGVCGLVTTAVNVAWFKIKKAMGWE